MAKLLRRIDPSFSILLFVSYLGLSNLAFAQLTGESCASSVLIKNDILYRTILDKPSSDPMKWCPLWAATCNFIYRTCPTVATCEFTNYDSRITVRYDPSVFDSSNYIDFLRCTSCNVKASFNLTFYGDIVVPVPSTTGPAKPSVSPESLKDTDAENSSASSVTAAITALLVIGAIAGSVIAVKTGASHTGLPGPSPGGATATLANPKTGSGNNQPIIDAVTLLLHFQSISTSGLLSLSYPTIYRFFTYNFAWANLINTSDWLKDAVRRMVLDPSCLSDFGALDPTGKTDPYSSTGMTALGTRYELDRATIGGLVFLTEIIGVAVSLAVFFVISVILRFLNAAYKPGKFQAHIDIWPSIASSMTLRLFIWLLGSIATFAIHQLGESCSSLTFITLASLELFSIILILTYLFIFIKKIAKTQGPEALYRLSESEESVYSRKWGSLYGQIKPVLYWFFISDFIWVFVRGIIIGGGQTSGIGQVCALICVELVSLLTLLSKPYNTSAGNTFHIFSTCKRLVTTASLLFFWGGFSVPTNAKRIIGIILITVESTYAVALLAVLLFSGGARIAEWNTERKERRRASATATTTITMNFLVPPIKHEDSDFSSTSSMHEKPN